MRQHGLIIRLPRSDDRASELAATLVLQKPTRPLIDLLLGSALSNDEVPTFAVVVHQPLPHGVGVHRQVGLDMKRQAMAFLPAQNAATGGGVQTDQALLLGGIADPGGGRLVQSGDDGGQMRLGTELGDEGLDVFRRHRIFDDQLDFGAEHPSRDIGLFSAQLGSHDGVCRHLSLRALPARQMGNAHHPWRRRLGVCWRHRVEAGRRLPASNPQR